MENLPPLYIPKKRQGKDPQRIIQNTAPTYIPRKRCGEDLEELRREEGRAEDAIKGARHASRTKAHGDFNYQFWSGATDLEAAILHKNTIKCDIALSEFEGPEGDWKGTEVARRLFEKLRAQRRRVESFSAQRDKLSLCRRDRSLRAAFIKYFTTSPMGLGINSGAGDRPSSDQSNFRRQLLKDYDSLDEFGNAWCPVAGCFLNDSQVTASHLFPWKAGQDAMDAIFGKVRPAELFSSRNGLILNAVIERYFDAGVMVIVPDIPDRPPSSILCEWRNKEAREYTLRIIDNKWAKLDQFVVPGVRFRDLDGKRLEFRTNHRPAARFVYFHYCMQIMRRSWRVGPGLKAATSLEDELGKPYWGTPGKYIAKNMLLAFIEEVGHEAEELMIGAANRSTSSSDTMVNVVTRELAEESAGEEEDDEEEDEDYSDEEV